MKPTYIQKRILICLSYVFQYKLSIAQITSLGKNEKYLVDSLSKLQYSVVYKQPSSNGSFELIFAYSGSEILPQNQNNISSTLDTNLVALDTLHQTLTYEMQNEKCIASVLNYKLTDLPIVLNELNEKYKKIDETHWADMKGNNDVILFVFDRSFAIEFKKKINDG